MKAKDLSLFAFLISAGLSPAQSQDDRMITTVEMNQCWMEDMLRGNQEEQIIRIRKRLLMDTALFKNYSASDRIVFATDKLNDSLQKLSGMPLFVVNGIPLTGYDRKNPEKMIQLTRLLAKTEKFQIYVLDNPALKLSTSLKVAEWLSSQQETGGW